MTRPWTAGAATAAGSLPGTDPHEAARLVFGELPDLPFLAELPGRGPGAQMVGRAAALLMDMPVEIVPSGWRLTGRPGRDLRRARDLLAYDLDAAEVAGQGYAGPLKTQVTGPLTLAASIELPNGHRAVSDPGAVRDLTASLAAGVTSHLADLAARVPGAVAVLQLDEPTLPAVLAGHIPTPSGHGTVRAVTADTAEAYLRTVLAVAAEGSRVVHCCAADAPIALLRRAGADALSLDLGRVTEADGDDLGEAVDAGASLWLGVVPGTDAIIDFATARDRITTWWRQLGFPDAQLADVVVPTTACGLVGASPDYTRRAMSVLRDTGHALVDLD